MFGKSNGSEVVDGVRHRPTLSQKRGKDWAPGWFICRPLAGKPAPGLAWFVGAYPSAEALGLDMPSLAGRVVEARTADPSPVARARDDK
jgi:hypothetical protein